MKYYIIAGEASGDLHASNLMRSLFACDAGCDIRFWGGDAMLAVGGTRVRDSRDLSVMGGMAVLSRAGRMLANLSFCKRDLLEWKPDAVILVDFPGFNLKVARFAHRHGFKVFYYIAPKAWAHGEGRVKSLRRDVDALYCILPFEVDWFRARGIEPRWFGNPLLDDLARTPVRPLDAEPSPQPCIALLPGSREAELAFLMPRFVALERLLAADPRFRDRRLIVAAAPDPGADACRKFLPEGSQIEVVEGRMRDVLAAARGAVVCSGTATLETALLGVPQVVCYGFDALTWRVVRRVVKVPFASLPNLSLGRAAVPELLQDAATPEGIFRALEQILTDTGCRERMQADYEELKTKIGGPGASDRIAQDIHEQVACI